MDMDDIVRNWFVDHNITLFNIIIVCIILTEKLGLDESKLTLCKTLFSDVINKLLVDMKIDCDISNTLLKEYETLLNNGMVDEFIKIICDITNNPNLINNKWISDNTTGRIKNQCFPCRSKSNRKSKTKRT